MPECVPAELPLAVLRAARSTELPDLAVVFVVLLTVKPDEADRISQAARDDGCRIYVCIQ